MQAKLKKIAARLRQESLWSLALEAKLRAGRAIRKRRFEQQLRTAAEVEFHPTGAFTFDPDALSPEEKAAILGFADHVLQGRYPMLGYGNPQLGLDPDWQRDFVSGKSWDLAPSESLRVVRHDGSDVKAPWELSRLQFLPVLAKAHRLSRRDEYRDAIKRLLAYWIENNPIGRGVNWTLAMEAALRGISICITAELLWPMREDERPLYRTIAQVLWQHLLFIEAHNEFSHLVRSNHYLSNIVGLATISASLRGPQMSRRFAHNAALVQHEIQFQTYDDGGDYEGSTSYHVLVLQMFLHSYAVQKARNLPIAPAFLARLVRMCEWLAVVAGPGGVAPHLGDHDDARVELLHDDLAQANLPLAQRNSLRVASLLSNAARLLSRESFIAAATTSSAELLKESGIAILRRRSAEAFFCAMPNGIHGKGSHSHNDKLSVLLNLDGIPVLADSGMRGYTRDGRLRNLYRSGAAHNVLVVDGLEQNSVPADLERLFVMGNEATVSPIEVSAGAESLTARAFHQGYSRIGVQPTRTLQMQQDELVIEDSIEGKGTHRCEFFYQIAPEAHLVAYDSTSEHPGCEIVSGKHRVRLSFAGTAQLTMQVLDSEISRAYGASIPAKRLRVYADAVLPARFSTSVRWYVATVGQSSPEPISLTMDSGGRP